MGGDEVPKVSSAGFSDKFSDYFRLIFKVFLIYRGSVVSENGFQFGAF